MWLHVLVIGGFSTAWIVMMLVVARLDQRLRTMERRWEKLEGLWKI